MFYPLCSKPKQGHMAESVQNIGRGLEGILWIPTPAFPHFHEGIITMRSRKGAG